MVWKLAIATFGNDGAGVGSRRNMAGQRAQSYTYEHLTLESDLFEA